MPLRIGAKATAVAKQLLKFLEQLPSFANELAHLGAALKCLLRVGPVLQRILIAR